MAAASSGLKRLAIVITLALVWTLAGSKTAVEAQSTSSPRRVVSMVPAVTEMIYAMHAQDRLIAVSSYDRFPPDVERFPKLGGLLDPNIERLIALRPDLVVVYDTQTDLKQQLDRAGIPYFRYVHRGLPDITETMRALGRRLGVAEAAGAAADTIEQQLAAVRARVQGQRAPKTLLVFGRDPGSLRRITASGGYGFLHDILVLAGGDDVLGDVKRQSVDVSTEMLLTRAPEVIIELHYGESLKTTDLPSERRVWNLVPSLPAVKNDRVYLLTGDEFVVPGPRVVLAAQRFAELLHP